MLTDSKLKSLKPKEKLYKVTDRDGLYVAVRPTGRIVFRYDYRINGRKETLTIGHYGPDGLTLSEARERLNEARRMVTNGVSPASDKRTRKQQVLCSGTVSEFVRRFLVDSPTRESTRALRRAAFERDILPVLGNRLMREVTPDMVRGLCDRIKSRGSPSGAVLVRNVLSLTYKYAAERGYDFSNPTDSVKARTLFVNQPRERVLSPDEIGRFFSALNLGRATHSALWVVLLTLVRKNELVGAQWSEVDFGDAVWTIPAERMKNHRPHNVYLSRQAVACFEQLRASANGSRFVLPGVSRDKSISHTTLNRTISSTLEKLELVPPFTVHDLRRTASTLLHEMGFNSDWIEKCLAHTAQGVRAVYNKAKYAAQRREMLQAWADKVDEWVTR